MQRETETSQLAYVTFKESQGADTAMLLTGSTIADLSVSITRVENYQLPPDAPPLTPTATRSSFLLVADGCCLLVCCSCWFAAAATLVAGLLLLQCCYEAAATRCWSAG
ncbi:uncharacterized protein LOC114260374 [Camellia sinensis]|uniref:uncharacterized protein LOC114260374 n=1 Tax=Camellia sinensis TaxID=4442 RepID=UPI00103614E9|nr:uncharacterized protein LOC114260374 [Camellia sinensis]